MDIDPKQALPTEVEVEGFNNIAGALAISPSFMEQYLSAARACCPPGGRRAGAEDGQGHHSGHAGRRRPAFPAGHARGLARAEAFASRTCSRPTVNITSTFRKKTSSTPACIRAACETEATLVILIDGVEMVRKEIGGPEFIDLADRDGPEGRKAILAKVSSAAQITAGRHDVTLTYIERSRALSNDATSGGGFIGGNFGGNVGGRVSDVPIIQTASRSKVRSRHTGLSIERQSRQDLRLPAEERSRGTALRARRSPRHLATEAFRRPVTDADVKLLMKFYELGRKEAGGFDSGVTELVTAVLSSPDFLYRAISTSPKPDESRLLNDLELASRLSFFLWSRARTTQLIKLAAAKKLSDPAVMKAQVDRMLKDPRANALIENFALWLAEPR